MTTLFCETQFCAIGAMSAAKHFSLISKIFIIDIVSVVDSIRGMKGDSEKLFKKFEYGAENIINLPISNSVI